MMRVARNGVSELAVFGGRQLFDRVRPIGQLSVPDQEAFFANLIELRRAPATRRSGLMGERLEAALCKLHEVDHCVVFGNASLAIVVLTRLLCGDTNGEVILPAFTYVGLPHLVRWAGQRPRFADVDARTHALTAATVADQLCDKTTAILAVHQVNAAADPEGLQRLADDAGIPLYFDSVHGLYNTWRGRPIGSLGRAEVFSLHATKILNGFEGGYVTTQDARLAELLRASRRHDCAEGFGLGMAGSLSEVHAAFVLAGLDELPQLVARNEARYRRYQQNLRGSSLFQVFSYADDGERYNYEFALVEVLPGAPISRDDVLEVLLAENTRTRGYYAPAVHLSSHRPAEMVAPSLPVTEVLSERFLQMPVGELVSLVDIDQICALLLLLERDAAAVAARLKHQRGAQS